MIQHIAQRLEACRLDCDVLAVVINSAIDKAFCAGGDVRALLRADIVQADIERFFIDEYRLDYAIHCFPKPVVVVMDAVTMGGGMGLAQGASLRVTTERSRIAMPETKIGMLPDVGATHFLAAMPVETALYVGLTGAMLSGADAVMCGLADVCVPHATLAELATRICALDTDALADQPDALAHALRDVFAVSEIDMHDAPIKRQHAWIAQHFMPKRTPSEIVASLRGALDGLPDHDAARAEREWLEAALAALTHYSPTMIHVAREALLRGRDMTLADSFRMEMGIVIRAIMEGDFREGVRANLVDKDRAPKWEPDTLDAVTPERVAHFLASPWPADAHPLASLGER